MHALDAHSVLWVTPKRSSSELQEAEAAARLLQGAAVELRGAVENAGRSTPNGRREQMPLAPFRGHKPQSSNRCSLRARIFHPLPTSASQMPDVPLIRVSVLLLGFISSLCKLQRQHKKCLVNFQRTYDLSTARLASVRRHSDEHLDGLGAVAGTFSNFLSLLTASCGAPAVRSCSTPPRSDAAERDQWSLGGKGAAQLDTSIDTSSRGALGPTSPLPKLRKRQTSSECATLIAAVRLDDMLTTAR